VPTVKWYLPAATIRVALKLSLNRTTNQVHNYLLVPALNMSGNKSVAIIVVPTNPIITAGPTHGAKLWKNSRSGRTKHTAKMLPAIAPNKVR